MRTFRDHRPVSSWRRRALGALAAVLLVATAGMPTPGGAVPVSDPSVADKFLAQVYVDLLGRDIDPIGLGFFRGLLVTTGASTGDVADEILASTEYRQRLVGQYYERFLHRPADPPALQFFVDFLGIGGGTAEALIALIVGSAEYRAGLATPEAFVEAAYLDLLDRPAGPADVIFWAGFLGGGTHVDVVEALLASEEYFRLLVSGFFDDFLGRDPDLAALSFFVQALRIGATTGEQVIGTIIDSPEYLARAVLLQSQAVAEPGSLSLAALGLAGVFLLRRAGGRARLSPS